MIDLKEIQKQETSIQSDEFGYLKGGHNFGIRIYFYINAGLNVLNNFRNLFLGIFAVYIALKLTNPVWMVGIFIPSLVVLCIMGWYVTHYVQKIFEWINIRFSTFYGIKQFNFSQGQFEMLEEIRDLLKKIDAKEKI